MITSLARRLGFAPAVSAALVDSWSDIAPAKVPTTVAPRGGLKGAKVGDAGQIQPDGAAWSISWAVASGANWQIAGHNAKTTRSLNGAAVIETVMATPDGPVHQRIASAVVDGRPALIVEIENLARVAVAVASVVRPVLLDGRGHVSRIEATTERIAAGDGPSLRLLAPPAAIAGAVAADGDLLAALPAPDAGSAPVSLRCRSGAAQAAAVWPLPHTATLRYVVELAGVTSASSSVPTTVDINRGWSKHLEAGFRVDVGDDVGTAIAAAQRQLLTSEVSPGDAASVLVALAESGFVTEARDALVQLERVETDDARVLQAVARWFQLDGDLEVLADNVVAPARAAHGVATQLASDAGSQAWLPDALGALAAGMRVIDQPDVGERIGSLSSSGVTEGAANEFVRLRNAADASWSWAADSQRSAAEFVRATRAALISDRGEDIDLLGDLPLAWRGQAIDVFNAPVPHGALSFGIRWHGPRPALLWEFKGAAHAPFRLTCASVDPDFATTEIAGETLLADPSWSV